MDGFLQPVQDAMQNFSNRQGQIYGIGMEERGASQRQQALLEQQRQQLVLNNHIAKRQHLENQISDAIPKMSNSVTKSHLAGLAAELAALKDPELGKAPPDLDQYSQRFYDILQHDNMGQMHDQANANSAAAAVTPQPGAPGPQAGTPPGQPPMIRPIDAFGIPRMSAGVSPVNPIQPSSQQGGGTAAASPFRNTDVSAAGASAASAAAPQPVPPVNAPAQINPIDQQIESTRQELYGGMHEPWEQQLLVNRMNKLQGIQMMDKAGYYDQYPELRMMDIGQAYGMTVPPIMFGQPQQESMDVSKLTPEQRTFYGIPQDMKDGTWTALRSRIGTIVGGFPGRPQERLVNTATGPQVVNLQSPNTPAQPLVGQDNQPLAPTQSFQAFYQKYLQDRNLQHTSYNMGRAWEEWNAKAQKPPQALGIPAAGGTAQLIRPGTQVAPGTLTPGAFSGQFTPTTQSKRASELAADLEGDIEPRLRAAVDMAEAKVGPAAGRWNNWWVGKGGANDPEFTFLKQAAKLYASAVVNVHFGGRGGLKLVDALEQDFGQAQSADDFRARMAGADIFLDAYAKGASSRNTQVPKPPNKINPASGGPLPPPKPGDVVNGFTFKGGDYHKQYNWAPAPTAAGVK